MKYLILFLCILFTKCSCQNPKPSDNTYVAMDNIKVPPYMALDIALVTPDSFCGIILNDIDSIPLELYKMKDKLLGLTIQGGRIKSLPVRFSEFKNLKSIAIQNTQIRDIAVLSELKGLVEINLGSNQMKIIPDEICHLPNLKTLVLNDNPIQNLEILTAIKTLEYLRLDRVKFKELPNNLFELTNLTYLSLNNNGLVSIPIVICRLTKLKRLNIANNKIEIIPNELKALTNLEIIDISLNKLSGIPNELLSILSLKALLIGGNNISKEQIEEYKKFGKFLEETYDEDDYDAPDSLLPKMKN